MTKKIYISAPINGYDLNERKRFFEQKEEEIKALGYIPVSPMRNGVPYDAPVSEHFKADLKLLLDCDEVWFYGNINESKGCLLEWRTAYACNIPRSYFDQEETPLAKFI